ncbi:MAG: inositol monophosphatase [Alphaproteobacteria bacterium]|nr:inositol monophosphatase [Alphaproteobacteria bacterium]
MKPVDPAAIQKIIEEVAAVEIMPRFRNLENGDIQFKGCNDPVTIADKAAEEALIKRLTDALPGSTVVGEESHARDPAIIARFGDDADVWVIDPIDGTRNFIEGRREFGVMVAQVRRKETVAAWIHDPNTGHTLSAERGGGVWCAGKKMVLAGRNPAIPKLIVIGSRLRKILCEPEMAPVLGALPALAIGSAAAFDYARLFTGEVQFANSVAPRASCLLYRISKPWDHVPGLFLHAEALGYSADFYGMPYDAQNGKSGLLLASDKETWTQVFDTIKPSIPQIKAADA